MCIYEDVEDHLTDLYNGFVIGSNLRKYFPTGVIYMNFSKAFDKVRHR
jgi:hypothetical protein